MIASLDDDKAKARLEELRAKLAAGAEFAALARDSSEDVGSAASGGDLGYSAGDAFPKEFEEALAKLRPGEVSAPVRTDSGWHLVKLLDERTQQAPGFEEQRATIEQDLQKSRAEPRFVARAEQLADLTYNSEGLGDAARELGLELRRSEAFGKRGGEGIFADSRVIGAAFGDEVLQQGQNSEAIEVAPGHSVVVHVREHAPERQLELAEVEPRVRELLVEAVRREQARARADRILAELAKGGGIEQVAGTEKLEWQVLLGHGRAAPGLPPEVDEAVFALPRAADKPAHGSVALGAGEVVVFEAQNFREGDIARFLEDQRKQMRSLLSQARGAGAATAYRKQLRAQADVRVL
jgi:peptidyl-prolyl cis-trans isomerase D